MSRRYFVSRHPGAATWARQEGLGAFELVTHLDLDRLAPGDTVIGTLPVHLASGVCERGARFFNLSLDMPPELRGCELSAEDLRRCNARIERYHVQRCDAAQL